LHLQPLLQTSLLLLVVVRGLTMVVVVLAVIVVQLQVNHLVEVVAQKRH
jgi:hypothetical protein